MTELPSSTPDDPASARMPMTDDHAGESGTAPGSPATGEPHQPAHRARHRPWYRRPAIWIAVAAVIVVLALVVPFAYARVNNAHAPAPFATLTAAASSEPSQQPTLADDGASPDGRASPGGTASPTTLAGIDGDWQVSSASQAGYRVQEVLNGQAVTVVGRTDQVSGTLTVSGGRLVAAQVTVQMATVSTDSSARDGQFRGAILATDRFPTATFVADAPVALDPAGGSVEVPGMLTIKNRGVHVTAQVQYAATTDGATATGAIPIRFEDWGIEPPNLGFVKVEPSGTVEFSLVLSPPS